MAVEHIKQSARLLRVIHDNVMTWECFLPVMQNFDAPFVNRKQAVEQIAKLPVIWDILMHLLIHDMGMLSPSNAKFWCSLC